MRKLTIVILVVFCACEGGCASGEAYCRTSPFCFTAWEAPRELKATIFCWLLRVATPSAVNVSCTRRS